MDFGQEQRNPGKHMVGIGVVLGLHVLLGWALLNGLAQRMVEVIKTAGGNSQLCVIIVLIIILIVLIVVAAS